MERVRVSDGNGEFTTTRAFAEGAGLKIVDKPAVDDWGRDIPTKYHVSPSQLRRQTKAELEAAAAESGVPLDDGSTKDEIVAALTADTKEK